MTAAVTLCRGFAPIGGRLEDNHGPVPLVVFWLETSGGFRETLVFRLLWNAAPLCLGRNQRNLAKRLTKV